MMMGWVRREGKAEREGGEKVLSGVRAKGLVRTARV